ncbi:hypothetical protein TrVE_jg13086 [Triparma verrucosa]|uniref:Uncharacterized protein n=2 Tax=Triparma TaxID=722752 RepID=A0A9W7E481_9STRA|nr:hypothetical protein TrST_g13010 [Triparma strigata]GMH89423.1 hypothetical protein TrVE_jg13086 [Triparma verrucosa]
MDTYYRSTETDVTLQKSTINNLKTSVTTLIKNWYKTTTSPSYTYSTTESSSGTTLSVLKYILFSIGEDVSEDIVVSRDVSEFEDEIVVTFWREEGVVPVEVLEGMNGGEVPEEVKMEAKIKAQNHMKNSQALLNKSRAAFEMSALKNVETVRREVKLGGKKRDRRTLEEIQMDMKKKVKHVKEEGKEV